MIIVIKFSFSEFQTISNQIYLKLKIKNVLVAKGSGKGKMKNGHKVSVKQDEVPEICCTLYLQSTIMYYTLKILRVNLILIILTTIKSNLK